MNLFRPYESAQDGHEDRLTRAALIVMRLVPLAQDAFLRLAVPESNLDLGVLPRGEFDTQRVELIDRTESERTGIEDAHVEELVSVFLTPDESYEQGRVELRERGQRLDGLIRYGRRLIIAIESKIQPGQWDGQARYLSPHGITFEKELRPVVGVPWHDLLERWLVLSEEGLLAPSELLIIEDFFLMAEEHFADLLPFTTLKRAGSNVVRQQRRLRSVLGKATVLQASEDSGYSEVVLDCAKSVKLARLARDADGVRLSIWPGELKDETRYLYDDEVRASRLRDLADEPGFAIKTNGRLGFRYDNGGRAGISFSEGFPLDRYIDLWISPEGRNRNRAFSPDELHGNLLPWLSEQGLLERPTDEELDLFIRRVGGASDRKTIYLRQGLWMGRFWNWEEAVELDEDGDLVGEVRTALNIMLSALGEELLPYEIDYRK